jgi:spermidine/putrescine transport system substrate-binding protein
MTNAGEGDEQAIYDFINSRMSVDAGIELVTQYGYGHANSKTFDAVPTATLEELGIAKPEEVMSSSVFLEGENPPYDEIYIKLFEEVMSGI